MHKNKWINDYPANVRGTRIFITDGVTGYCSLERESLQAAANSFAGTYDHNDHDGVVYIEVTEVRRDGSFGKSQGFCFAEAGRVEKTSALSRH